MGVRCYYSRKDLIHYSRFRQYFDAGEERGVYDFLDELPSSNHDFLSIDKSYDLLGKLFEKIDPTFQEAQYPYGHKLIVGQKDWQGSSHVNFLDWAHIQEMSRFLEHSNLKNLNVFFENFVDILVGYFPRRWPNLAALKKRYLADESIDWEFDYEKLKARRLSRQGKTVGLSGNREIIQNSFIELFKSEPDPYKEFTQELDYYFTNMLCLNHFIQETAQGPEVWLLIRIA